METLAISFVLFTFSFVGIEGFRRFAIKKRVMIDVPNERSSHLRATPRGAGVIFVVLCLLGSFFETQNVWFTLGALLVCSISFIDDLWSLPAGIRLFFHFLGAFLVVYFSTEFSFFSLLGIFWIAWLINAYNFMDGIDGIAAMQALTAGTGWIFVGFFFELSFIKTVSLFLVTTVLGFILHNFSPARVFMGDVGSAFLGYGFATLPLIVQDRRLFVFGLMSVFLFVFDTTFTLFRRIYNGEKFWQAHRSHLYQRLVISGLSHGQVTFLYGFLSVVNTFFGFVYLIKGSLLYTLSLPVSVFLILFLVFYKERRERSSGGCL
ncbi:MAG: glycosyltransferase family 4 protein [Pyrinomonadaceae bacterium]|nr:glycosyltransferase family 4 protein [Pyrinomonadaceae bacterium]MCX7640653.1 glycosyltransferase family 4 protein [Pyrinomonadaceae bacterium]MDW8305070.1 glycosyltransferase family 4 protein [Acidobacteriota bacterium]